MEGRVHRVGIFGDAIQWIYHTRQPCGVGLSCTFNQGSHTVVFGRLYGVGMPNWFMDGVLDGQWEVVGCTVEIRNGWSKSIG